MEKAKEIIEDVSNDMIGIYDVEEYNKEMEILMKLHARDEGRIEGESKKQKEIAKTMLDNEEDIETICKYTGLSKEEIGKLQ